MAANPWFSWTYVSQNASDLAAATRQHVALTFWAILVATLIALPLAVAARRWQWTRTPILTTVGILYTIPSLALFVMLQAYLGLSPLAVEIALVGYALVILVRNALIGLDGVPAERRIPAMHRVRRNSGHPRERAGRHRQPALARQRRDAERRNR